MMTLDLRLNRGIAAAAAVALLAACEEATDAEPAEEPIETEQVATLDETGMAAGEEVAPFSENQGPAYLGVWARDDADCALAPGGEDPAPVAFTDDEFFGFADRCTISHGEATDAGWRLELYCLRDGVEHQEYMDVAVADGSLRLARDGQPEIVLTRCE